MKIYKSKSFAKFTKKEGISNQKLFDTVNDAEKGIIYADYGDGVIKQRISRKGGGKSGGYRSIVLFRVGNRAFFVHGFAKKDAENITPNEIMFFKEIASIHLHCSDQEIDLLVNKGIYQEVVCDE
ncbi:MAG: type II toxin-antitoxin system RelE/ParE family toxin [Alphaproteobacteria bacterium]